MQTNATHSLFNVSSLNGDSDNGFAFGTAWCWLQKLRRCTIRQNREKLSGRVEVDEFFIGGQKSGKRGRGAEGKIIAAVAVER